MIIAPAPTRTFGQEVGFGFLYWLSFLLALEPGNIARAVTPLALDQEALRILGASILGGLATPAVAALMRRYPIEGDAIRKHLTVHGVSAVAIAFGLIAASCLLAPLLRIGDTRPFSTALPEHLAANWLLLAFSLAGLTAMLQAARFFRRQPVTAPTAVVDTPSFLSQVQIKARGRVNVVDLANVDWIEAQGNYVALHCGAATHLWRETLTAFEAKVDPAAFARVHRSCLVNLTKVAAVAPRSNGDGVIRLVDGAELRLSRSHRGHLHERLAARVSRM